MLKIKPKIIPFFFNFLLKPMANKKHNIIPKTGFK
jgi:hypothetical protein